MKFKTPIVHEKVCEGGFGGVEMGVEGEESGDEGRRCSRKKRGWTTRGAGGPGGG